MYSVIKNEEFLKEEKIETNIPKNIQCEYIYKPSIKQTCLTIKIIGKAELPRALAALIDKISQGNFVLDSEQKTLFTKLLESIPSNKLEGPIQAEPLLSQQRVVVELYPEEDLPFFSNITHQEIVDFFFPIEIESALESRLTKVPILAITGIAGVGKTQLALHYAKKIYESKYSTSFVYKILADNKENLLSDYKALATTLGMSKDCTKENEIKDFVNSSLNKKAHFLLIFDNVDEIAIQKIISGYFPNISPNDVGKYVLITSKIKNFFTELKSEDLTSKNFAINGFLPQEAEKFINQFNSTVTQEEIKALAVEFSYLPLGLATALIFMQNNPEVSITEYLTLIHDEKFFEQVENEEDERISQVYRDKEEGFRAQKAAIRLSIKKCDAIGKTLLTSCSFLSAENIPHELLLEALKELMNQKNFPSPNELDFKRGLTQLEKYSLISRFSKTITTLRVVQSSALNQLFLENKENFDLEKMVYLKVLTSKINEMFTFNNDSSDTKTINQDEQYLPHLLKMLSVLESLREVNNEIAKIFPYLLLKLGDFYFYYLADDDNAEKIYQKASDLPIKNSLLKAKLTVGRGNVIGRRKGSFQEVKNKYFEALNYIQNESSNEAKLYTASLYGGIAGNIIEEVIDSQPILEENFSFSGNKKIEEAKHYLEKAYFISEEIYKKTKNTEAMGNFSLCAYKLGDFYKKINELEKALEYFSQDLNLQKEAGKENHAEYAGTLIAIGEVLFSSQKYQECLEKYNEALKIQQVFYNKEEHPNMVRLLRNRAKVFYELEQDEKAIVDYTNAYKIIKNHNPIFSERIRKEEEVTKQLVAILAHQKMISNSSRLQQFYQIVQKSSLPLEIMEKLKKLCEPSLLSLNNRRFIMETRESKAQNSFTVDLVKAIEDWGKELAKGIPSSLEWIDLEYKRKETIQSSHYKEYKDRQFKVAPLSMIHSPDGKEIDNEKKIINSCEQSVENNSDSPRSFKLSLNAKKRERRSYILSKNINLGASLGITPPFAEMKFEVDLDYGSSKEQSKETEKEFNEEMAVEVKGKHQASCLLQIWEKPVEYNFTLEIELKGEVPLCFKDRASYKDGKLIRDEKGHRKIFIPINEIFEQLKKIKKLPDVIEYRIDNEKVILTLRGQYKEYRYNSIVKIQKETSLGELVLSNNNSPAIVNKKDLSPVQSFTYAPSINLTGSNMKAPISFIRQLNNDQFSKMTDLMLKITAIEPHIPPTIVKDGKEAFQLVHESRPKPEENKDRSMTVAHSFNYTGAIMDFTEVVGKGNEQTLNHEDNSNFNSLSVSHFEILAGLIRKTLEQKYQFELIRLREDELIIKAFDISAEKLSKLKEKLSLWIENEQKEIDLSFSSDNKKGIIRGNQEKMDEILKLLEQGSKVKPSFAQQLFFKSPINEGKKEAEERKSNVICKIQ